MPAPGVEPARAHRYDGPVTPRASLVLRLSAAWAVWVWAVLVRNMIEDRTHALSFRLVHIGLAVVSLGFAAATWRIAGAPRRAARAVPPAREDPPASQAGHRAAPAVVTGQDLTASSAPERA